MLMIKLKRIGKKHQASFRFIVSEKRSKVNGRYIEDLGWLNPKTDELDIKKERVEYWLKNGAQPTDTVHNLLVKIGLVKGPKIAVHAKSKKQAPAEEKAAAEEKEKPVPEEKPAPEEKSEEKPETEAAS
jgi:small subunit ribosomal protein S16